MTPLQKAAQAVIDRWESPDWKDAPHTAHYVAELRKALDAELAQSVEPVAWMYEMARYLDGDIRGRNWQPHISKHNPKMPWMVRDLRPLYLHPPQPQATTPVSTCGLDTDTLRDMAGAAFEEAMAFGISTDSFERLARHVNKAATKAAQGEKP